MNLRAFPLFAIGSLVGACSASTPSSPTIAGYQIASADQSPLTATVGDAKRLTFVQLMSDGTTAPVTSSSSVTWSGPPLVKALAIGSTPDSSTLPQPGASASAIWIQNPDHFTGDELAGVLWVLDTGTDPHPTVAVTASLSAKDSTATATATIVIGAMAVGDIARGQTLYGSNCASCHGPTGQGTTDFPGLNNAPDHVASDPSWNASLLAMAARSDMDNLGVSLDPSMPKWLTRLNSTGQALSASDFADIYGFLKTQTQ